MAESKIFATIVGALNSQEQFSKVYVNCVDPEASDSSGGGASGLEASKAEVIFPPEAAKSELLPIVGGAIVKIELQNTEIDSSKGKNPHRISRYGTGGLKSFATKIPTIVDFPKPSDLLDARVQINKSLESMPNITSGWYESGVPMLQLSSLRSDEIENASDLDSEIGKRKSDNIRVSGLSKIGGFKFIPINVLGTMLEALTNTGDENNPGLGEYVGISGVNFEALAGYLSDSDPSEDEIIQVLLDMFPIFNIDEDYIDGEDSQKIIGYFTAVGDHLYVKMPDLSGRDSSGFSSNVYGLGDEDPDDFLTLCFELKKRKEYAAVAIDYLAPPAPELSDGQPSYSDSKGEITISLEKEGLDENGKYKFFLSPIIDVSVEPKAAGFRTVTDAVEMFTAPIITKPLMTTTGALPTLDASDEKVLEALQKVYGRLVEHIYGGKLTYDSSLLTALKTTAENVISNNTLLIVNSLHTFDKLGVPLSVAATDVGVDLASDLLGEMNRPEILLGVRESGDDDSSIRRNDRKYFNEKTCAAKEILVSNRPNYITDLEDYSQVPAMWMALEPGGDDPDDEDSFLLKIPFKSNDNTHGMDIYDSSKIHSFALYVIDELGQIIRVPGQNIEVYPQGAAITLVRPNGYNAGGTVFAATESLGCITLTGEAFSSATSVNIYSDEAGQNLVATLTDGAELSSVDDSGESHTIMLNHQGESIEICSGASFQAVLGSADIGTYWVGVQLGNGTVTPILKPIYIAQPGTLVGDLPEEKESLIKFFDPGGLKALKFGSTIDSVPILMDGGTSEIRLKYGEKVFSEDATLYAYIAVAKDEGDVNKKILEEDVGWLYDEGLKKNSIITTEIDVGEGSGTSFYIPTNLEYTFGSDDFSMINKKKVKLKFPGTNGAALNMSRFTQFESGIEGAAAYIILTTKKLSDGAYSSFPSEAEGEEFNYAYIPLGNGASKKAFVTPPYVSALVVELKSGSGNTKVQSNTKKSVLQAAGLDSYVKRIDLNKIGAEGSENLRLVTTDEIKRMAVVFEGNNEERRLSRVYKSYIGTKAIKKYRAGRVQTAGNNKLVLNYRNIKSITGEGWLDIVISKKDKRFRATYDSTLYNRTTVTFYCPTKPTGVECTDIVDGEIVEEQVSGSGTISVLISGEDRMIPEPEGDMYNLGDLKWGWAPLSDHSYVFPKVSDLSPLPLLLDKSYDGTGFATDSNAYYNFANPVKIIPSVDLVFGYTDDSDASNPITYGVGLSDAPVGDDGLPKDEVVKINTNGSSEVMFSIADATAAIASLQEQGEAISNTIDDTVSDLQELAATPGLAGEELAKVEAALAEAEAKQADFEEASDSASESISDADSAQSELEAAEELAREAGGGDSPSASEVGEEIMGGIEDAAAALDAAVAAINNAIGMLGEALAMIQSITDQLSSLAMLGNQIAEGLEQAASSMGPRPDDFTKVNIKHIYIDKDASIPADPWLMSNEEATEFKLALKFKFEQTAAIRFNVPEIIEIRAENPEGEPYTPVAGERLFGNIVITTGSKLFIKTIGANADTKIEVGGKRIKARRGKPFNEGIYNNFEVTMPDLNSFSLFGSSPCVSIAVTNSNENRMRTARTVGNDIALNLDDKWSDHIFGGGRNKSGPPGELKEKLEGAYLKFTSVTLDKANVAKEFLQSFCDMSFHLTAELSLQLRNFKVILVPIKVILCIIDVICALLHPIRLAFAIIRLFLCLYDLILLLPQLSVPAMFLALLLHIIELLLCVILKILGIINAINEIITALENAIEQKNFPACIALEETINEHLFSLEADLSVLDPILTILALFLELLQLIFSFPCQVGADEDDEACIDPSQLAGIIVGKVAPFGRIEPDALLPLAQAYTRLPVDQAKSTGNSPPNGRDNINDMDCRENDTSDNICSHLISLGTAGEDPDFIVRPEDQVGSTVSIGGYAGNPLTGLKDSVTGEFKQVEEGGWFSGDIDGSGDMDNIQYPKLRFQSDLRDPVDSSNYNGDEYIGGAGDYFDATFGLSFTRSTKKFSIFTGPDPRIVSFDFNSRGETADVSWWWKILLFPLFFRKKLISELQTLDSPPMFLTETGGELVVDSGSSGNDFVSPIDGATGFLESKGSGYQPKPLTVTFELNEPDVNEETLSAEFTPVEVTKTFGNIPMIALVDDAFNVYFVEEDGSDGGIKMDENKIESINVKMINHPSAPKKKFGREEMEVYRDFAPISTKAKGIWSTVVGEEMLEVQANAIYILGQLETLMPSFEYDVKTKQGSGLEVEWATNGDDEIDLTQGDFPTLTWVNADGTATTAYTGSKDVNDFADMPFPKHGVAYDFGSGNKKEANDLGNAIDSVKVFDFPRFYIVDMRQVADDIAAACGASGPMELLLDLPGFEDTDDLEDGIKDAQECLKTFLAHFNSEEEDEDGKPTGLIPRMRYDLELGVVPEKASVQDIVTKYEELKECIEDQVGKTCRFVLNPLNTSFKILNDDDETPLPEFIDPEQEGLAELMSFDIVDELEYDDELAGFPSITGAMEYASGIGDSAVVEVGDKALISIIPRDCYDEVMPPTLDLTDSIKIEFLKDETGSATLVEVTDGEGDIYSKDEGEYTIAISAEAAGKVQIKATICSVVIQAVTDRGIVDPREDSSGEVDCVDDAAAVEEDVDFAPGALMKVDRILTILFVPKSGIGDNYGDADRDESGRSSKPSPQTFGTKLEN